LVWLSQLPGPRSGTAKGVCATTAVAAVEAIAIADKTVAAAFAGMLKE
jgi:hypothetical protein